MRSKIETMLWTIACLLAAAGCHPAAVRTTPAAGAEARLAAAKVRIMDADYRADLAGLARLRDEIAPLAADPTWGYLAHYWAGFASWRLAINGASHGMTVDDLRAHLERAGAGLEESVRQRADFADGCAAAAGVYSWLPAFLTGDVAAQRERLERSRRLLARAKALEPENPRVLWVEAAPLLFLPADHGGDPPRAVALYRRMIAVSGAPVTASALPDWGKPEAHMSLAFAHLNQAPDLAAAEEEAHAALALRPDWSYVKDILLPQIEKARAALP